MIILKQSPLFSMFRRPQDGTSIVKFLQWSEKTLYTVHVPEIMEITQKVNQKVEFVKLDFTS